eukprot:TRINITY_DN21804_c0_g1_i1.p1 TRINITY_DN21804_c0_g1~~TRINITY_DN21804_c0_g1_i1.p1  ORF type:complete len:577 (-),score=163.37 TRINITY_DN21804_c0_g1_i1:64-1794(-)
MASAGVGVGGDNNNKLDNVSAICLTCAISVLVAKHLPDGFINLLVAILLGFLLIRTNPVMSRQLEELVVSALSQIDQWFKSQLTASSSASSNNNNNKAKKGYRVANALGDVLDSEEKDEVLVTHNSEFSTKRNVASEITYVAKGGIAPGLLDRQMTSKMGMRSYKLDRQGSVPAVFVKKEDVDGLRIVKRASFTARTDIIAEREDEAEQAEQGKVVEEEEPTSFENVVDQAGIVPHQGGDSEDGESKALNQFLFRRASGMLDLSGKNFADELSAIDAASPAARLKKGVRPPVNIQIASDLHIEMVWNHSKLSSHEQQEILDKMITPSAPYLVLAGDIGCPGDVWGKRQYSQFIEKQADSFEMVFVIAGNHEYYSDAKTFGQNNTAPQIHSTIKQICSKFHNVVFLDRKCAILDGVRLVGVTLWSDVDAEQENHVEAYVSDYKRIRVPNNDSLFSSARSLTVKDSRAWHKVDVQFIEWQCKQAEKCGQDVVLVSHHGPLLEGTSAPSNANSPISSAFSSDLSSLMQNTRCIKAWIFGHTHHCADFVTPNNGIRVVSNQHGYFYDRSEGYKPDFVLTV